MTGKSSRIPRSRDGRGSVLQAGDVLAYRDHLSGRVCLDIASPFVRLSFTEDAARELLAQVEQAVG